MPRKESEKQEGRLSKSVKWMGPILLDMINAWLDRPKFDEIMDDLEAVARENERLAKKIRFLTAAVVVLAIWMLLITFFLVMKARGFA